MKTYLSPIIGVALGVLAGYLLFRSEVTIPSSHHLTLEQILSIKELHLVRHHYQDLFFIHRKNKFNKSIRAIVKVPVTVVAYLDLKAIQIVKQNDTIRQVILPKAKIHQPEYEMDKMQIEKTRSFQLHAGKDLYPEVSSYMAQSLTYRMDSIRIMAIRHKILEQAETEGKEYIEGLLKSIGRSDIQVKIIESPND